MATALVTHSNCSAEPSGGWEEAIWSGRVESDLPWPTCLRHRQRPAPRQRGPNKATTHVPGVGGGGTWAFVLQTPPPAESVHMVPLAPALADPTLRCALIPRILEPSRPEPNTLTFLSCLTRLGPGAELLSLGKNRVRPGSESRVGRCRSPRC